MNPSTPESKAPSSPSSNLDQNIHIAMPSDNSKKLSESSSALPILNDDNWGIWYKRMEEYCIMKDLDGIIDGTKITPKPNALIAYRKREKHVVGVIRMKLGAHLLDLLVNDNNKSKAHQLWTDIKTHFMSSKARNRGRIFSKLFSLRCDKNDVSGFIKDAKSTLNKLESVGVKTDKKMIAYWLLHLLPPAHGHLKSLITHGAEITNVTLSVNWVVNLLQQEVHDSKVNGGLTMNSSSALSTTRSNNKRKNPFVNRFGRPCCGEGKHNPAIASHTS